MKIEDAKKVWNERHKRRFDIGRGAAIDLHSSSDVKKAAQVIIVALESKLADERKESSDRHNIINKQAVTILSMRNCGNCDDGYHVGSRQICVGCHGYRDVDPKAKKSYLANWKPIKNVVKAEGK